MTHGILETILAVIATGCFAAIWGILVNECVRMFKGEK